MKYNDNFTADIVKEHGEYCLSRMMGHNAKGLVPAASVPIYVALEQHMQRILADNEKCR